MLRCWDPGSEIGNSCRIAAADVEVVGMAA